MNTKANIGDTIVCMDYASENEISFEVREIYILGEYEENIINYGLMDDGRPVNCSDDEIIKVIKKGEDSTPHDADAWKKHNAPKYEHGDILKIYGTYTDFDVIYAPVIGIRCEVNHDQKSEERFKYSYELDYKVGKGEQAENLVIDENEQCGADDGTGWCSCFGMGGKVGEEPSIKKLLK